MRRVLALLFLSLLLPAALAAPAAELASPDGHLRVQIDFDKDGRALYAVTRDGQAVIAPSQLGFLLADTRKLDRGFAIESQSQREFDETWEQPWGEQRFIRNRYHELHLVLRERESLRRRLEYEYGSSLESDIIQHVGWTIYRLYDLLRRG